VERMEEIKSETFEFLQKLEKALAAFSTCDTAANES
jgi:hypothetical protein